MNAKVIAPPLWSTASFEESSDSLPMELSALGQHLDHCHSARERWFAVRSVAEKLDGFVASRLVSTLVVVALLIAAGSLVI